VYQLTIHYQEWDSDDEVWLTGLYQTLCPSYADAYRLYQTMSDPDYGIPEWNIVAWDIS
jgi:hypothetical protein